MRLLHLADLHLGTENYGRPDPQTGLNSRLFDFLRCFDAAVDCAIEREVDLVVFAGDAYRSREPNPTHQREFARRIHRLVSSGIPVLLVAGNHDLPSLPAKASSLDVFSALEVPGVTVVRQPQVLDIETRSGVVRCACLPALPRAALLEDGDRRLDADALRRKLSRRLARRLADLAAEAGDSLLQEAHGRFRLRGRRSPASSLRSQGYFGGVGSADEVGGEVPLSPSILVAHVAVEGAVVGSEVSLIGGAEPMVPLEAVADNRYAYVALGHVHRFQELSAGPPPVVYCGSLDRVDFGEEGQKKGFVVADIEAGEAAPPNGWRASYEFVPTPARRFVTIDVEATEPDATAEIERAAAAAQVADAVVRLRVTMDEEQPLDEDRVRAALREAFWALPMQKQVRAAGATPRAPEVAERMTDPLAALDEYLNLREVSQQRARALREKAQALLADLRREAEPAFSASQRDLELASGQDSE